MLQKQDSCNHLMCKFTLGCLKRDWNLFRVLENHFVYLLMFYQFYMSCYCGCKERNKQEIMKYKKNGFKSPHFTVYLSDSQRALYGKQLYIVIYLSCLSNSFLSFFTPNLCYDCIFSLPGILLGGTQKDMLPSYHITAATEDLKSIETEAKQLTMPQWLKWQLPPNSYQKTFESDGSRSKIAGNGLVIKVLDSQCQSPKFKTNWWLQG